MANPSSVLVPLANTATGHAQQRPATFATTPSPRELLRVDPAATVHTWTDHLRVPPATVDSSAKAVSHCRFRSVDAIHGPHGVLGTEAPVATVFIPDLAERLSRRGAGLLRSSFLSSLSLQSLRDNDDERLETFIYLARTLNKATIPPTTASANETYAKGVFYSVGQACAEVVALWLARKLQLGAATAASHAVSERNPDVEIHVDSILRALFELKNKDATRLGDPNAQGEAAADGLIRAIDTYYLQLASAGSFVSALQGLPGSVLSGPKVLIMQLLRSALRLPECHFLAASAWEYALPMYILKLKGMQQPPSPLPCTESTMLPVSRSLRPRTTPSTNPSTVDHPPYILAVGRLVPISGSVAKVGHSLPHMVIGGSVSDDIGADLLSLINNDPRYNALANDLRLAGYGAAASSSSGASAGGLAGGASSGSGGSGPSGSSSAHSASSSRQHTTSLQLSAVPPSHIPATTLPLSTFPIRESSASQSHDVHELSRYQSTMAVTDRSDNAAESFYRPLTLQELRKSSELEIGYLYSNGTIGDVFPASTLTAAAPAAAATAYDSSRPSTPIPREQNPQYLTDTPPEPGIPVLPLGVDPIGTGADGVVHQVIGFGETSLVAKVYHADRLEAAATELSIYRNIFDALPNTKLVPRLFGAYRGSQYLEWETNIVVMEDGGSALRSWTDLTPDERATLYARLHDLHAVGIYHNDIRSGNVLRSSAGQLRFIDLTTAFIHTCEGHDCYELQRFREILEI